MATFHTFSDSFQANHSFAVTITAASTNGAGVDTQGFRRAVAVFHCNASGSGTTGDCKLQESADNSTFADVTSAAFTQSTTAGAPTIQYMNIDLAKRKRYLRLVFTGAGASAAGAAAGSIHLGEPQFAGVANTPTPITV